jgi:hypothetical protein
MFPSNEVDERPKMDCYKRTNRLYRLYFKDAIGSDRLTSTQDAEKFLVLRLLYSSSLRLVAAIGLERVAQDTAAVFSNAPASRARHLG